MSDKHQDSEKRPDQQDQDKANAPKHDQDQGSPQKEMPGQPSSPDKA